MSFKIAIIGAGSVGFTKKLFMDILCVPEFRDVEFALTDLSEHNLGMIKAILDRILESNRLPAKVT
ncbi:MAG: alpha-glucosidase/alpha-galactosidase, partial [Rhizobium sp.]